MAEFTLDTSGVVGPMPTPPAWIAWTALSPFVQGYVEALFASLSVDIVGQWLDTVDAFRAPAFRDLSSEAMALILRDCEAFRARYANSVTAADGRQFFRDRQRSYYGVAGNRGRPCFPPLTVSLSDEGKVELRPTS